MIPLEVRNFQILQFPPANYLGGLSVIVFGGSLVGSRLGKARI